MILSGRPKYTPRANEVIKSAARQARQLGHPSVGSQHLLFALLLLGSGVQFHVLTKLGLTYSSVGDGIRQRSPDTEENKKIDGVLYGLSAVESLDRAADESRKMMHSYVGTEHILLGLLAEQKGGATDLFASHGVNVTKAREMILEAIRLPEGT